jgi:hypothetical protein
MSNHENLQTKPQHRRRRKFVRKDLQLKIILGTLFVSLMILFFNFQIPLVGLWAYNQTTAAEGTLPAHMNRLIIVSFFISVLLTVPLAVWMGVIFSFQFCGPIYAIKKFFVDFKDGAWTGRCRLREKDDLKDLRDVVNECFDLVRARVTAQKDVLDQVESLLREATFESGARARVSAILESIVAEKEEYDRRFPAEESVSETVSTGSGASPPPSPQPDDHDNKATTTGADAEQVATLETSV